MRDVTKCPYCGGKSRVYESRKRKKGWVRWRRCYKCYMTWKTVEVDYDFLTGIADRINRYVRDTGDYEGGKR